MTTNGPVLVLVGPPGSGKSTIGRMAAERLGVGFRDFDDDMAAEHGKEAGDLVVDLGRERFQQLEHELLIRVLPQHDGVLALGGGTPTAPGVPDLLKPYSVVFLDVDLDHLLKREGLVALHPWLLPNPRAHLKQMLADRRPIYTQVADATVETNGRDPQDILEDVLAAMPVR
ncbi:shikimate kinase [Kibdelosporangium philippinense]|uniref:Shikimate kinase n=1 Tax=Kibdelosporangium philippinense TaxID=211113 RepID=A0ABS8ZS81_9PSEU|nr:shikimate kinase [Kibdelosporangium philippinense]MCE7010576.1 shikimate kinase [Kibdelosporangium philippinense]